jgi:hypothetical protein
MERASFLESMRNRNTLAEEIKEIIRWKIPNTSRVLKAYQTVRAAFLQIVSDHFHQQPNSNLQWSRAKTNAELIRLANQFFGLEERVLLKGAIVQTDTGPASGLGALAHVAEIGEPEISRAAQASEDDDEEPHDLEVS